MSQPSIAEVFEKALGFHRVGQFEQAAEGYRQILSREPGHVDAMQLLGLTHHQAGRSARAIELIEKAVAAMPGRADLHNNLGVALRGAGRWDRAMQEFELAVRLKPDYPDARANLAEVQLIQGESEQAEANCRAVIEMQPNLPSVHNNLAIVLRDQADFPAARVHYRRAIELHPGDPLPHSNLIYTHHFDPDQDRASITAELSRFNEAHVASLGTPPLHENDRTPDRRLKIGYVSPDFRSQAEAYFVVPLLEAHDRESFEVHCYSTAIQTDLLTDRHRRAVDQWHDVRNFKDDELARQISSDRIDILMDLTMHMRGSRLLVFARKPAPVQFTWLAYPGTTGIRAIDYRLTDAYMEPHGADHSWSAEKPVRLPDSWCCYLPLVREPPVNELPATKNGFVTFGSLNQASKHNDQVIGRWGRVLAAVKDSRLLLLSAYPKQRRRILEVLGQQGIGPERVEFTGPRPGEQYLRLYHRLDIGLDPLPYNGITTTCDSLRMGVPVISQTGLLPASRAGLSLLSTVGLPELVAGDEDTFVRKAAELAGDLPRLNELRSTLRQRIEASPLMDAKRFARNVEAAYRDAWRQWCAAPWY